MNFIAFDLETTGISPRHDSIVEIGAVEFIDGAPTRTFGTLINPGIPIPPDASSVNGITDEMVAGQPRLESVLDDFANFCGGSPLVAHNAPFDFKFLLNAVKVHRSSAPGGVVLDTLPLSRRVFPGLPNYKLWTLVRHFGFPSGTFHRAEEDSAYCGRLFHHIVTTLEQRQEPSTVADLVKLTGKSEMRFPRCAPQQDQLGLF